MRNILSVIAVFFLAPLLVAAEPAEEFAKWEKEIAAIEARDAKEKPADGGFVFVGSSSIRLWDLKKSFPDLDAVNHGFGGSTIADSVHFVDRLVINLKPKIVVFYAGDNDIATGKSPQQVARDFRDFIAAVHAKLEDCKIIYLPIKPSPARWEMFEKQRQANGLIRDRISADPERLKYVDLVGPMLGDDVRPRPELFRDDKLHLSDEGYALWNKLLLPHLEPKKRAE